MSRRAKHEYHRHYTVSDPRSHPKGYTEYKVTAKVRGGCWDLALAGGGGKQCLGNSRLCMQTPPLLKLSAASPSPEQHLQKQPHAAPGHVQSAFSAPQGAWGWRAHLHCSSTEQITAFPPRSHQGGAWGPTPPFPIARQPCKVGEAERGFEPGPSSAKSHTRTALAPVWITDEREISAKRLNAKT